jgi:hypothetical protein
MAVQLGDDKVCPSEPVVLSKAPFDGLLGLGERLAPDLNITRQWHMKLSQRIDDQAVKLLCLRRDRCELDYITGKQPKRLRRIGLETWGTDPLWRGKRRVITRSGRRRRIAIPRARGDERNRKQQCRALAHTCG